MACTAPGLLDGASPRTVIARLPALGLGPKNREPSRDISRLGSSYFLVPYPESPRPSQRKMALFAGTLIGRYRLFPEVVAEAILRDLLSICRHR